MQVVAATGNAHKLAEIRALLADLPVELLGQKELPPEMWFESPEETGTTFEANADLKAIHAAGETGMYALADDSGFEIDALDGRPGVRSARYAGDGGANGPDVANNVKLAAEAREAGLVEPVARFRCVVSLAAPNGSIVARGEGSCEGVFIQEARGGGGFGYDPHFLVPDLGQTFAEIGPEAKNEISHRARALADLRRNLEGTLGVRLTQ